MTTREIADAVGKTERTVHNWVSRVSERNAEVSEKIAQAKSSSVAASYSLDETIEIIETGMGKNAAAIFRQNAEQAKSVTVHDNADIMAQMMKMMLVLADKVAQIQTGQLQIEAPRQDYYTLIGYCSLKHIKTNFSELSGHGMKLREMTISAGKELRKVPDERWGHVNSYPISILEEYFTP